MRRDWPGRLRALFLGLLFLSTGTVLPGADALLDHGRPRQNRPHIEASTFACHAERCLLEVATAPTPTLPPAPPVPQRVTEVPTAAPAGPGKLVPPARRLTTTRSRAPPPVSVT